MEPPSSCASTQNPSNPLSQQRGERSESMNAGGRAKLPRKGDMPAARLRAETMMTMDPPYVPRADDNCYMKLYHFLEGLSCYWEGVTIMEKTRVKKIAKPFTPFSYRKGAAEAFSQMFRQFADSILVLSYSSNGYPDLSVLLESMSRYKSSV
jgi:adenine-specific DNA-methyltransferase